MSDLEDKIFRQNVPGRWSSIDTRDDIRREEIETNNDHNNNNDNGDDDNDDGTDKLTTDQELLKHAKQMDDDGVPDPIKRRILMERENMHSTGVKGVLADYKTHLKLEQARKEAEKEERKRIIDRMVNGAKIQEVIEHNEVDETLLHLQSMLNKNIKSLPHEPETLDLSDDDDDDDDDFEDDEFMTVFRQQRMQEMIAHASKQQKTSESDTSLPIYGECIEVFTSDEFLEQIDKTDSRSTLVLHVYDPSIRACITLNQHLQIIAHEWRHVKFILMNIDVSEIQIDRVALPALSIYRGGNCINVITAIAEELAGDSSFHSAATRSSGFSRGDQFTIEDIKWIFETSEGWN